jgi:hypothetical protein
MAQESLQALTREGQPVSDETVKIAAAESAAPKKGGIYVSVELPKGYEPKPGDGISFRMNTEITWNATCWKHGPLTEDGCETTCLLTANHDGEHEWTRNDEIMG